MPHTLHINLFFIPHRTGREVRTLGEKKKKKLFSAGFFFQKYKVRGEISCGSG